MSTKSLKSVFIPVAAGAFAAAATVSLVWGGVIPPTSPFDSNANILVSQEEFANMKALAEERLCGKLIEMAPVLLLQQELQPGNFQDNLQDYIDGLHITPSEHFVPSAACLADLNAALAKGMDQPAQSPEPQQPAPPQQPAQPAPALPALPALPPVVVAPPEVIEGPVPPVVIAPPEVIEEPVPPVVIAPPEVIEEPVPPVVIIEPEPAPLVEEKCITVPMPPSMPGMPPAPEKTFCYPILTP